MYFYQDRPAQKVAYVRVIGAFNADKVRGGFDQIMNWGRHRGLLPGATLIGMSRDNPDITPMERFQFDWCLVVPPDLEVHAAQRAHGFRAHHVFTRELVRQDDDVETSFTATFRLFPFPRGQCRCGAR